MPEAPNNLGLARRVRLFFPQVTDEGVCFAYASMGLQAFLAHDLATFSKRIDLIFEIPEEDLVKTINDLKKDRTEIVNAVKKQIGTKKLNTNEINLLMQDESVKNAIEQLQATIDDLISEGKLPEQERNREFEQRKESLLFNAYVQKQIEAEIQKLPQDKRLMLDIPIFFEGLAAFQASKSLNEIIDLNQLRSVYDLFPSILPVVISKKLSESGGVAEVYAYTGIYNYDDLQTYLESFAASIDNSSIQDPVVIMLATREANEKGKMSGHAVSIGYDPVKGKWSTLGANTMELVSTLARTSVVPSLLRDDFEMPENETIALSTQVFVNAADKEAFEESMTNWMAHENWQFLHDESTRANFSDFQYNTWLHLAVEIGNLENVKRLLNAINPEFLNFRNDAGKTALEIAIDIDDADVVKLLLAEPMIDLTTNDGKNLIDIVEPGTAIAELLMNKAGLTPETSNRGGDSELEIAIQNNDYETVKLLLEKPGVNLMTQSGNSLLNIVQDGRIAELLLDKGLLPGQRNKAGDTPLMVAAFHGNAEVVKVLLSRGSLSSTHDKKNNTAMHYAAANGHLDVVEVLLDYNPDISSRNYDFKTAEQVAQDRGHSQIAELLKARRIETTISDIIENLSLVSRGYEPAFFSAPQSNNPEIIQSQLKVWQEIQKMVRDKKDNTVIIEYLKSLGPEKWELFINDIDSKSKNLLVEMELFDEVNQFYSPREGEDLKTAP